MKKFRIKILTNILIGLLSATKNFRRMSEETKEFGNLWGGRFSEKNDPVFEEYNKSIHFDCKMCQSDIEGSKGTKKKKKN